MFNSREQFAERQRSRQLISSGHRFDRLTLMNMSSRNITIVALLGCGAWFLLGTLPQLANYPVLDWPQMGIAAPAHKLATEGVYGNDLFAGFYRTELRNYEYMPAYPMLVAMSFKLFGLGVVQARMVSVVCGLITILLTYKLSSMVFDRVVGVAAVGVLTIVRLSPGGNGSGIPLIDFARVIRYDNLVPVFVLASCLAFLYGHQKSAGSKRNWWFFTAGCAGGLATLSHIYGAFVMTVFVGLLLWQSRSRAWLQLPIYVLVLGWCVALLPWLVYVLQDVPAYVGQMARHEGRFDILNPVFYANNLLLEYRRYAAWTGGFPEGLWLPRVGFWLMFGGVLGSWAVLWPRTKRAEHKFARFAMLTLPLLALQLALLLSLKRHIYTILILPFIAMQVAFLIVHVWRWTFREGVPTLRAGLALVLVLTLVESGLGITRSLQAARKTTRYEALTSAIAAAIPAHSSVLIAQPYWMGLADYETRSINLAFVKANEVPMREALRELNPDYVVVERSAIDRSITDPRRSPDPRWTHLWSLFAEYLEEECSQRVLAIPDPSYGIIDVYACGASRG